MSTTDSDADPPEREHGFAGGPLREARLLLGNRALEAAGIGELVAIWREAGFRDSDVLSISETGAAVHVVLDQPVDESRVSSLDSVKRWARITESRETSAYVFECTPQAFPPCPTTSSEDVIGPYDLRLTGDGILMSIAGPHGTISDIVSKYESAGLSPHLRKIGSYDGDSSPLEPLDGLTARQREVLTAAFEQGYFAVPREATTDDLAADLDVAPATVREHIQRAQRNLFGSLLGAEQR